MSPASQALRAVLPDETPATNVTRAPQDFEKELWVGIPKDKTLGVAAEAFLKVAGLISNDKVDRIDDYTLETPEGTIRVFEMKGKAALALMAKRQMDATIVGRDGLKPFNAFIKKQKGFVQASESVDLALAPCTLTVCLPEADDNKSPETLNGRVIVVAEKFRKPLEDWAKRNKIEFAEIVSEIMPGVPIEGGVEGYRSFDKRINAMCDVLQSAESAVRYGWKPLGVSDADWNPIREDVLSNLPKKDRRTYIDLPSELIENLAGTVIPSNPVLARISSRLSPQKERLMSYFEQACINASTAMGGTPVQRGKRVGQQQNGRPRVIGGSMPAIDGYGPHSRFNG